jgi:hypothetical protein
MNDPYTHFYARHSLEDVLRATLLWHFSDATGSPYWLKNRSRLPFDPLIDIQTIEDLDRFEDCTDELKSVPVSELIPRGLVNSGYIVQVFESGGTMGEPKRIIELNARRSALLWIKSELDKHTPLNAEKGHWLFAGPSGPHLVGRTVMNLASMYRKLCYYIDFDPRWVKKCVKQKAFESVRSYIGHIVAQCVQILTSQEVTTLFTTPAVLEAFLKDDTVYDLLLQKIKTVIWFGTSMAEDALKALEQELLPHTRFIGLYGNTLMGIAPQRCRLPNDRYSCVFQSYYPFSVIRVVKKNDNTVPEDYYKLGQVKVSLLTPDLFIPSHIERDLAVRIPPSEDYPWDGVAAVMPIEMMNNDVVIEGVY